MKNKLVTIAVLVCGIATSAVGVEEKVATGEQKVVRIKSGDSVVGELSIGKADKLIIQATTLETISPKDSTRTRTIAKGDVKLEIVKAGGADVVLTAQEIEIVPPKQ